MSPLASQERADAIRVHGALGAAQLEIQRLEAEVERLTRVTQVIMATSDARVEELQQLGDRFRRKADLFSADLAERDATIELVRALVEDPHAALVVDRIRAALEVPS